MSEPHSVLFQVWFGSTSESSEILEEEMLDLRAVKAAEKPLLLWIRSFRSEV